MDFEIIRPQALSAAQIAHWRALQAAEPVWDSPFLSPAWPLAVERAYGDANQKVRVAVAREHGSDVGYLALRTGAVTAMGAGAPLCDYQGLVAEPGVRIDPQALLRALGVQRFDFGHMLADDASFAAYARHHATSWAIDLAEGYDAYAAQRRAAGSSALKDLDKKRRKAERELGPVFFTAQSRSAEDFEALIALKREQLKDTRQTDIFAAGWTGRLMRDLFEREDPDFRGSLFTLHMGGRLAAAHFHLCGQRTIHGWMIAHHCDVERYSPGLLLFHDILRWMDATPYNRLDLGPGDYRFKRDLSNVQVGTVDGFVGLPSAASFLRGAAYGVRRAAESLPLGKVSALPGKAMRRLDILRGLR